MESAQAFERETKSETESERANSSVFRIYSPLGSYPQQTLSCDFGRFIASPELVVSVVYCDSNVPRSTEEQHLMLNSALLLATPWEHSFHRLYPFPFEHELTTERTDELLSVQCIIENIQEKQASGFTQLGETLPEFDCYQNAKGASLPLALGGTLYHLQDDVIDEEYFLQICDGIAYVMDGKQREVWLAGFDALVRSSRLSCHLQFQVEANHYLFNATRMLLSLLNGECRLLPSLLEFSKDGVDRDELRKKVESYSPLDYLRHWRALCQTVGKYLAKA